MASMEVLAVALPIVTDLRLSLSLNLLNNWNGSAREVIAETFV